jgi:hypothetical protein
MDRCACKYPVVDDDPSGDIYCNRCGKLLVTRSELKSYVGFDMWGRERVHPECPEFLIPLIFKYHGFYDYPSEEKVATKPLKRSGIKWPSRCRVSRSLRERVCHVR